MRQASLDDRLASLEEAAKLGAGRVPDDVIEAIKRIVGNAGDRRSLSGDHTVVGFFGATGSGKSSLFNAVTGTQLARTHVRRPTTSEPLAAVWHPDGASPLLDWLDIGDRHHPTEAFAGDADLALILIDLPDFDSVEPQHRVIAERLAGKVDVLVWVVDPQKYADAVIHRDFIAPLGSHAAVTAAVLNQVDLLGQGDEEQVVRSLQQLLRADGLEQAIVLPASAVTGKGVDAVRSMIARFARDRKAAADRLAADVSRTAAVLDAGSPAASIDASQVRSLTSSLAGAARVDQVAGAVATSYRRRAGRVTGWPVVSWVLALRPDPLRRMHLPFSRESGRDADVHRTGIPQHSAAQSAAIAQAVRQFADDASAGLGEGWRAAVRERANTAVDRLPGELDQAIARTDLGARGSWWWPAIGALQWISLLGALVGVGWLLAAALLPLWSLPGPEIPLVEGWPVPTLLIAAGVLLGIVLGLLGAIIGGAVGAARRARARRRLMRQVDAVARETVVEPVRDERDRAAAYASAVRVAAGRRA